MSADVFKRIIQRLENDKRECQDRVKSKKETLERLKKLGKESTTIFSELHRKDLKYYKQDLKELREEIALLKRLIKCNFLVAYK
jgi:predicted translin family RNA/ssDNA-binding protein